MPGLTVATGANPAAVPASASETHLARSTSGPRTHTTTTTTTASNGAPPISSRTSSPTRPPISPITPTLGPSQLAHNHNHNPNIPPTTNQHPLAPPPIPQPKPNNSANHNVTPVPIPDFALGRPAFTHSTHPAQQPSIQPPPTQPIIDFENNPDVLALKSSITILQLQRARATADMQALNRAKTAALADPEAFVADLAAGRIGMGDNAPTLFGSGTGAAPHSDRMDLDDDEEEDDDSDDDDDDDEEEEDDYSSSDSGSNSDEEDSGEGDGQTKIKQEEGITSPPRPRRRKKKGKKGGGQAGPAAWRQLPKPQNVVRCPPINWSQYGVVGESLDKLHAEQVAAPTPGAPLMLEKGGTYEFKAGDTSGERAQRLVGIAAPYVPGRDKLDKKGKGGRR